MAITKSRIPPGERFDQKVQKEPGGCWLWTGSLSHSGHGVFAIGRKLVMAARYSYTRYVGSIPVGQLLLPRCSIRNCVNPQHLEPVTRKERAALEKVARLAFDRCQHGQPTNPSPQGYRQCNACLNEAARLAVTHCRYGHPLEGNTYTSPRGYRHCKTCRSAANKRRRERKKQ